MIGLVLAAAGTGTRFGSNTPKQFTQIEGRPLYLHALDRFLDVCDEAVIVVPGEWIQQVRTQIQDLPHGQKLIVHRGGPQRQDSVYQGLCKLSDRIDIALVHDAARPFPSSKLISEIIEGTRKHEACVPVLPVIDTVKEVQGQHIIRTLNRDQLVLVQTPQGFKMSLLQAAFEAAMKEGFYGTDESSLVERMGVPVQVVPGEGSNVKITWREDL
ncbi:MAG: 2-C-methyl-D-erythritol 4-phosphate cytidylyltransferase [Acidobacteriota bacterium]